MEIGKFSNEKKPEHKIIDHRDKILAFIKMKGPVLPIQIAKEIGTDILMASAHLAELTATGKLKVSRVKVGGSPLYLIPGQEEMLQKFITSFNDKELKAFNLLKEARILRDSEQEPVMRVALRDIKDFALQLNVDYNNVHDIFWKWFLLSDSEAEKIIKEKLNYLEREEKQLEEKKAEPIPAKEVQKTIKVPEEKQELQKKFVEKGTEETEKDSREIRKAKKKAVDDSFLKEVTKFFEKSKISVISSETVKKNSDIEFVIEVPSVMGNLVYYCSAKNKKKISDSDLSNAYVKGTFRKLPVIVISTGDLSPKAEAMIGNELKNLTFKKI
ncbi:MAG TPA: hypothetical protein VI564_06955 [Candidatus Nanoarchaeia archaeon]|nr:hypothetical protein [Candidatus Nanoarchaeia archaeon]